MHREIGEWLRIALSESMDFTEMCWSRFPSQPTLQDGFWIDLMDTLVCFVSKLVKSYLITQSSVGNLIAKLKIMEINSY
ncbi:hypothetical protein NIES3974_39350 [Calothrix sp. NIES-3974]|nr:hypothetical protein NIES3974_39350 [Calothrix sp. NIES-3974]